MKLTARLKCWLNGHIVPWWACDPQACGDLGECTRCGRKATWDDLNRASALMKLRFKWFGWRHYTFPRIKRAVIPAKWLKCSYCGKRGGHTEYCVPF